jgi:hypothetical protein
MYFIFDLMKILLVKINISIIHIQLVGCTDK